MLKLTSAPPGISLDRMRHVFAYQPFCLPDGTLTGAGGGQAIRVKERWMHPDGSDPKRFAAFKHANERMARNYEDIIAGVKAAVGAFDGLSFADVAANAGYFCYRMLQEGCASATGIEPGDHAEAYIVANHALGLNARLLKLNYDMMAHRIDGLDETFDIVSCQSFMCHSSDPTFQLAYLSSITRKALVIYTMVPASKDMFVRYGNTEPKYFGGKFPICFDAGTEISEPLLRLGFDKLGFSRIVEIPRRDYWVLPAPS